MLKNKSNRILFEIIGVIIVFTVIYFVSVFNMSHAFKSDTINDRLETRLFLIEKISIEYANREKLLDNENVVYITVNDLLEKGYLFADDENGNYFDPSGEVKTLNDTKIKIVKTENGIEANVL